MKICQVLGSRGWGGLERHFIDLCNRLARHHQVIAVADPEFRDRLDSKVLFEPFDLSGWRYNPLTLYKLYRLLAKHRPEIIHAQANKAAAMVGTLRSLLAGKCVATIHNFKRDTRMYRPFDRVIAVSHQTASLLDHPRVDVVYNGIEPPLLPADAGVAYVQAVLGGHMTRPIVMAAGRLVPAKGFDVLLRAWLDIPAFLVLVGEGPERSRLEAYVRDHDLSGRVIFAGYRRDVPALLAGADLMVISSYKEGFSYFLAEGLHVRLLAVATRVPIAMEILPDKFLVDCGDHRRLAEVINGVLNDLDGARRDFEPVWELAARELTLTCMVEKTEQVYEKTMLAR